MRVERGPVPGAPVGGGPFTELIDGEPGGGGHVRRVAQWQLAVMSPTPSNK
jgi:hypothetical protein